MSNKNKHLVVAYFPTVEEAQTAADDVKEWDKNLIKIDLGAIGILTMDENGKVKTKKVGDHAASKGAKWGLALGAVAGIFTGGLSLIGGALAGVAIGAVGGAMFHRGLGMTDEQKADLESHLKEGGAALVIVTPAEQIGPTESVLNSRSNVVYVCEMDDETAAEVHEASEKVVEEAEPAPDSEEEAEPAAESDEAAPAEEPDEEEKPAE